MKLNATQNFLKKVRKALLKHNKPYIRNNLIFAVVKERIKTQQQTIDRLNNQSQQTKHQLKDVKEKLHSLIRMK